MMTRRRRRRRTKWE
ncbi:hypothetical protein E2C01_078554 [Portunus trituberculatus]|uniref:Uncharacterized protein n=1 Tax=Portunus trituberculatus TaxID=210409 RepID=A0A5B7IN58_PORTR|nr:hypothetical protein [Portunus trituberculatus]